MGVNKLMNFLAINGIIPSKTSFSEFSGKTIVIDMSILIHRIIGASKKLSFKGKITTHIFGIFMKMYEMKMANINVVAVFDGEPPAIKEFAGSKNNAKSIEVKAIKEKATEIEDFMIDDIKKLLTLMGIQIVQSPGEADTQCAYLLINGIGDAVYSRDTDMLVFGCKTVLFSLSKHSGMKIVLEDIFAKLNITHKRLIDIANILGNDYFPGIENVGIKKVSDFTDEDIREYFNRDQEKKQLARKFKKARDYYLLKNVKVKKIRIVRKNPQYSSLLFWLVEELGFNRERTKKRLDKLKSVTD
jgi:flap endonuclease-1